MAFVPAVQEVIARYAVFQSLLDKVADLLASLAIPDDQAPEAIKRLLSLKRAVSLNISLQLNRRRSVVGLLAPAPSRSSTYGLPNGEDNDPFEHGVDVPSSSVPKVRSLFTCIACFVPLAQWQR